MGMNLGYKTTKLWIGDGLVLTQDDIFDNFTTDGDWGGDLISYKENFLAGTQQRAVTEDDFIDLGVVTDEREELALGGIPLSLPGTSVTARYYWAIGGKILRLTLSGIIPDGLYHSVHTGDDYDGKSNISVFRYKMNKLIAYQSFKLTKETGTGMSNWVPHVVQYRRKFIYEKSAGASTQAAKWIITGYSYNVSDSATTLRYTLTLDLANNLDNVLQALGDLRTDPLINGIFMRELGDKL